MNIKFDTSDLAVTLAERISLGFVALSLPPVGETPYTAVFWRADDTCFVARSKVFDVSHTYGDWLEIGYLSFHDNYYQDAPQERISLPGNLLGPLTAYKLVVTDSTEAGTKARAESGLVLVSESGSEIMIVAGAFPQSIQVSAEFLSRPFEPEYDIEKYERVALL